MTYINQWEQVPDFVTDKDEAKYWNSTAIDVRLMENSIAIGSNANESVTITLRMDPRMLSSIKRLARSRFLNYQSMIKQWLSERMEKEQRLQRNGND